jgi:hypothetical protein
MWGDDVLKRFFLRSLNKNSFTEKIKNYNLLSSERKILGSIFFRFWEKVLKSNLNYFLDFRFKKGNTRLLRLHFCKK